MCLNFHGCLGVAESKISLSRFLTSAFRLEKKLDGTKLGIPPQTYENLESKTLRSPLLGIEKKSLCNARMSADQD
jgi:hypothetical protein